MGITGEHYLYWCLLWGLFILSHKLLCVNVDENESDKKKYCLLIWYKEEILANV